MRIENFVDPYLRKELGALGAKILSSGNQVMLSLGYPARGLHDSLQSDIQDFLNASELSLDLRFDSSSLKKSGPLGSVILVASGKGGVGKSTIAANIALALKEEGAVVGLLDADIYGPSQGLLLGKAGSPKPSMGRDKGIEPVLFEGLRVMSMSYLSNDATPMVWRGPMASSAVQQILTQTSWGRLDYLIIDMPPGTGDIQLTISQQVQSAGAVIVTTPQDIALLDAKKAIEMFRKVSIPILGIVENMSEHVCEKCGHKSYPFSSGGASRLQEELSAPVLGSLPLDLSIRESVDNGVPSLVADAESDISKRYREIARYSAARVWEEKVDSPLITMDD